MEQFSTQAAAQKSLHHALILPFSNSFGRSSDDSDTLQHQQQHKALNNCAQVCTKQSASPFPHHQSSVVKLGICSILTLIWNFQISTKLAVAYIYLLPLDAGNAVGQFHCNDIKCSNQEPSQQNKKENEKGYDDKLCWSSTVRQLGTWAEQPP